MKAITKKVLEEELGSILEANATFKAAAQMVGFDVDAQTESALESLDNRIRVNIHQQGRINTLKSLIEDLEQT